MALLRPVVSVLLVALAFSGLGLSTCEEVLKGKVTCLDCSSDYDFSGIKVLVKCDQVKKATTAITQSQGSFEVEIPSDATTTTASSSSPTPKNCLAKLLGGPTNIYATRNNVASKIVQSSVGDSSSYTISTPLAFSTTCPLKSGKCDAGNGIGSSLTVNLPLPREWGLAPSSYYVPFIPIIGIP